MTYRFDVNDYLGADPDVREPAHIAEINGSTMRFFAPRPQAVDLPWIPLRDVAAICGFDKERTDYLILYTINLWMAYKVVRSVKTTGGLEAVIPFLAVIVLLENVLALSGDDDFFRVDVPVLPAFYEAAAEASRAILADVAPETPGMLFQLMILAARNAVAPPGFTFELRLVGEAGEAGDDGDEPPDPEPPAPRPLTPALA